MRVRRQDGTRAVEAEAMEGAAKREDGGSSTSDRVVLKKEIGLLTACAIIIGECREAGRENRGGLFELAHTRRSS